MVHGVASGTVQDRAVGYVLPVVDEDGPDLDEEEEGEVSDLLEWEDEGEDVVGKRLCPAVNWVECDCCIWRGHDPFVVGLVKRLVDERVMKTAVNEVDEHVREEDEEGEL